MNGKRRKSRKKKKKAAGTRQNLHAKAVNVRDAGDSGIYFITAFVISCFLLYVAIQSFPSSVTKPINENVAWSLSLALNAVGIAVHRVHDVVFNNKLVFRIIPECTPIFTSGIFLCFSIFCPSPNNSAPFIKVITQKTLGLMTGFIILYLGNLARLTLVFMAGCQDRKIFDLVHVYMGQVFTIFLVLLICALWFWWIKDNGLEIKKFISGYAIFLLRFALISGCVFFVWVKIHHGYIWLLDRFVALGFSLFGHPVAHLTGTVVYYETFSIVTFVSLVLAATWEPWQTRLRQLVAGFLILFSIHLFHRIDNVFLVLFNNGSFLKLDLTLLLVGQYLIPILFLIWIIRKKTKLKKNIFSHLQAGNTEKA